ncbi:MAG: hypothetical protein KF900_00320 [Bacteroidetes bacterium]|nr:hypothetical protein [Bacteroidota bacterium]
MKKSIFKNIVMTAILTLFTQTKMMGQITAPYNIYNSNQNNCSIDVIWRLIDGFACNNGCNISSGLVTIPANSFISIAATDFALCGTVCNVRVT